MKVTMDVLIGNYTVHPAERGYPNTIHRNCGKYNILAKVHLRSDDLGEDGNKVERRDRTWLFNCYPRLSDENLSFI